MIGLSLGLTLKATASVSVTAPISAGPDARGTIATPSAGVYRCTKTSGANAFNTGFYSPLRSGDFRYQIDTIAAIDAVVGLNAAPSSSSGFSDMVRAVYIQGGLGLQVQDGAVGGAQFGTYIAGNTTSGRFFWDRTGTTLTFVQGNTFVGGTALRTITGVSGSIGLDLSLFTLNGALDVQVLV